VERIERLRRRRLTAAQIAGRLAMPRSTVAAILKFGRFRRVGHRVTGGRSRDSRGVGWEFVHACVDDHSRLA
jgi:hypothetical protein